ncbi:MAG: hypothetical protein ACRDHW_17900, partial [Ktedonobacteraceae bacterium]
HGPAAQPDLPPAFCSFIHSPSQAGSTRAQVDFHAPDGGTVSLVGFQVQMPGAFLRVITYWKVNQPDIAPLKIRASLLNDAGRELFNSKNFTGATWCPSNTWRPGEIIQISTSLIYIGNVQKGQAHLALTLLPYRTTSATMSTRTEGLPFHIVQSPGTVAPVPGTELVQLQTITIS